MKPAVGIVIFDFAVLLFVFGGIATLRYELREDALCVVMFGLTMRRVPFANIESIRRGRPPLVNEHWNRISFDPCLTLRLRRGLIRNFIINPPDTDNFMAQVQARLH